MKNNKYVCCHLHLTLILTFSVTLTFTLNPSRAQVLRESACIAARPDADEGMRAHFDLAQARQKQDKRYLVNKLEEMLNVALALRGTQIGNQSIPPLEVKWDQMWCEMGRVVWDEAYGVVWCGVVWCGVVLSQHSFVSKNKELQLVYPHAFPNLFSHSGGCHSPLQRNDDRVWTRP